MRFSVDAHAIGQQLTGNETYIKNLLRSFASLDRQSEFVAYISRESAGAAVPSRFVTRRVAENPWLRLGFDLPRKLRQDRPALLHVQYTAPVYCPAPLVVSVHDVSFLEYPRYFTRFRAAQLRATVPVAVRRAARVLTASEFSRRSIMNAYGVPEDRIVVTPYAVSSQFRPVAEKSARSYLGERYDVPPRYILTVGDLQPRKNHLRLLRAFEELLREVPRLDHHLVIAGKHTWFSPELIAAARRSPVSSRIHFTGFVPDEDLARWYAACDVFVYPSVYEGFGLPILEAMACGRAVACSNTSAMPEVADSAAFLFDPHSEAEMVRALRDLLIDAELRARMERLALQRAALFSWERTARRTLEVYYEVAGAARGAHADRTVPAA